MISAFQIGKPLVDMSSHGDTWDASWADDGELYLTSDDTCGFDSRPGRNLAFHVLRGRTLGELHGETLNLMDEYGPMTSSGSDGCMWKANGSHCVDGNMYVFVSRHGLDFTKRQTAQNSSLIISSDKGRTWRRTATENYDRPMFPGSRLGSPFFVKYGRNGRGGVHNSDSYVYAVANNGFWENGDDMILARVRRDRISRLDASDWQFYTVGDGMADRSWSPWMQDAEPILVSSGKCSMTGIQYIAPLQQYLMIQWYYTKGTGHVASDHTTWVMWEGTTPWGPWQAVGSCVFTPEAYYNPCIVSKFISRDGRNLTIFANGDFRTHGLVGDACLYRLTQLTCTLVTDGVG